MRYLVLILAVPYCMAQHLLVYSPFTRIGPAGEVVKADRGSAEPRHILSPGVPRNAWFSLRIVVELEKPETFILDIGQNPENAVKATLYRENFVETSDGWIPDTLTKVSIPYRGNAADFRLPGQKVLTFWLDMWVEANAEVDRVKVEPQLWIDSQQDWMVYPMEVRVQQPVVPADSGVRRLPALPPVTSSSDTVVLRMLRVPLCSAPLPPSKAEEAGDQITGRFLLRRNISQQLRLAKPGPAMTAAFLKASGVTNLQAWCDKPVSPGTGPEWYLRLRDAIYRAAGAVD